MTKYRAKPITVDGVRFASKKEARRAGELKLLEQSGNIRGLKFQVTFDLVVNEQTVGQYVADFTYQDMDYPGFVVEDTKGFRTPIYRLKKKLMKAIYGIEIRET